MDVYSRADSDAAEPTLIFIHGGGWNGWNERGVRWFALDGNGLQYRKRGIPSCPGLACARRWLKMAALRWVAANAEEKYHFDVKQLVVTGPVGGWQIFWLTTAWFRKRLGLSRAPGRAVTSVAALLSTGMALPTSTTCCKDRTRRITPSSGLGSALDREQIAKRVSPLTYAAPGSADSDYRGRCGADPHGSLLPFSAPS